MTPSIRTPRLILRDHVRDDWDAIHRFTTDPAVSRFMAWGPNTPEDTTRFFDAVFAAATENPRRGHDRAVTRAANGRSIGNCVLHVHDPAQDTAFIGYVLDRAVWGQGFSIEVAVGLLGLGFEVLGLRRIAACG